MAENKTTQDETIQFLYSLKRQGPKLGLERMEKLLEVLNHPEKKFKSILVGGTNGKGSTVSIIYSILRKAGFRVGRYTSPHITSMNERIVVDEKEISDADLYRLVEDIKKKLEPMKADQNFQHPTFFEFTTAVAFKYLEERGVDFGILEVGLGGRLDATNTVLPLVSVITNVSLEHTQILGDTVEKIAYEKGGIIKQDGFLVTAAEEGALKKISEICGERNSRMVLVGRDILIETQTTNQNTNNFKLKQKFSATVLGREYQRLQLSLLGTHQLKNAACALGVVYVLQKQGIHISDDAVRSGLKSVEWPGRMEIVQKKPLVILDCAKDADAARKLADAVRNEIKPKRLLLVISISSDKNLEEMLSALVPLADQVIITAHKVMDRAVDPKILAKIIAKHGKKYIVVNDVKGAVRKAIEIAKPTDTILVTGSVFTVAEAREIWFEKNKNTLGLEFNETPRK